MYNITYYYDFSVTKISKKFTYCPVSGGSVIILASGIRIRNSKLRIHRSGFVSNTLILSILSKI